MLNALVVPMEKQSEDVFDILPSIIMGGTEEGEGVDDNSDATADSDDESEEVQEVEITERSRLYSKDAIVAIEDFIPGDVNNRLRCVTYETFSMNDPLTPQLALKIHRITLLVKRQLKLCIHQKQYSLKTMNHINAEKMIAMHQL